MRFIKRLVFVIILLLVAFFIYRLISPTAAKELLYDLKSFSNDTIGTHFSLSGENSISTGIVLDTTGVVIEQTGNLQEITGDDELLLTDEELPEEDFATKPTTGTDVPSSGTIVSSTETTVPSMSSRPKTTTKSVSLNGLSNQDIHDLKNLLKNFAN